jgi:hypothetical protein
MLDSPIILKRRGYYDNSGGFKNLMKKRHSFTGPFYLVYMFAPWMNAKQKFYQFIILYISYFNKKRTEFGLANDGPSGLHVSAFGGPRYYVHVQLRRPHIRDVRPCAKKTQLPHQPGRHF